MKQTFIKRVKSGVVAGAFSLASVLGTAGLLFSTTARALDAPNWEPVVNAKIDFFCEGGHYIHTLLSATVQPDGTFTGTGRYDTNIAYTWDVTGAVSGDTVSMLIDYTGESADNSYTLEGTVAAGGSVSGTASGNCESFTMLEGSFTPIEEGEEPMISEVDVYGDTGLQNEKGKWMFNRDASTATEYVFSSEQASIGDGSIHVGPITNTNFNSIPGNDVNKDKFIAEYFARESVENFESFSYDFKIAGAGDDTYANKFYVNFYVTLADNTNFRDCRFDFEPSIGSISAFSPFSVDKTTVANNVGDPADAFTCPNTLGAMPAGSYIRAIAINVGDTSASDTGLEGFLDKAVFTTSTEATTYDFEPYPVSGEIVKPSEGKHVSGWLKLKATYNDGDEEDDDEVQWAVLSGACDDEEATAVLGNTDGNDDDFQWDGALFKANLDVRALPAGEYCFVFDPTDDEGQADVRETRSFFIDEYVPERLSDCLWGGWRGYLNPSFKNQGQCVKYVVQNTEKPRGHHKSKFGGGCWGWWR